MRGYDRIIVDEDNARLGADFTQDLAGIPGRGDAGPDVEELSDPLACQEAHGAAEEGTVSDRHVPAFRQDREHCVGGSTIGGEMCLATKVIVVHARRMRNAGVNLRRVERVVFQHADSVT